MEEKVMDLQSLTGFTIKSVKRINDNELIFTFTNGKTLELYAYEENYDDGICLEAEIILQDNHDDNYTVEYINIK